MEDGRIAFRGGNTRLVIIIDVPFRICNVGDELVCFEGVWPGLPVVKVGADGSSALFQTVSPFGASPSASAVGLEFFSVCFGVGVDHVWLPFYTDGQLFGRGRRLKRANGSTQFLLTNITPWSGEVAENRDGNTLVGRR